MKGVAISLIIGHESPGKPMPASLCLRADATAGDGDDEIIPALCLSDIEWLYDLGSIGSINEILGDVPAVDSNLAVSITEIDPGDGGLAATYTMCEIDILLLFVLSHFASP